VSVVAVDHLRKQFGRVVAVEDVSFALEPGELVGLVGHNGAGKTTTLKMLTGQLVPTAGSIRVGGIDVGADPGGARTKIGYVPEDPKLYEYLSAKEMLEFVIGVRGTGDLEFGLDVARLGDDAQRLIREYSRHAAAAALACAMVAKPRAGARRGAQRTRPAERRTRRRSARDAATAERPCSSTHRPRRSSGWPTG
jgi:ABC-2 type transport system ATP-binding protein